MLLLVLVLAIAAERFRWFPRLLSAGAPERLWIWAAAPPRELKPRAFFLARDFHLDAVPAAARLEVMADPEYLVLLNGRRVGSAIYRPDAAIDVYDARPELRPGRNRLVLELRSAIGSGGATVRLVDGDGRELAASGPQWRYYPGVRRALADLDEELPPAASVAVLGSAPFGRWSLPGLRERPSYRDLVDGEVGVWARAWRPSRGDGEWRRLSPRRRKPDRLGGADLMEVDFGREVAGFLHLQLDPQAAVAGMLFFADRPGEPLDRVPDRVVVAVPKLNSWQDVEPRRFRYLTLVGLRSVRRAAVIPLRPAAAAALGEPAPSRGLLGLPAEPARLPLVETLRRELLSGPQPR